MNWLHRSSLHPLCVLLVKISGSALPADDFSRYNNRKISENLINLRKSADDRMPMTGHPIKNFPQIEHPIVDSHVSLKNNEKEISIPAPIEPGRYKLPLKLFQNGEQKTAVIRNILV